MFVHVPAMRGKLGTTIGRARLDGSEVGMVLVWLVEKRRKNAPTPVI